MVTLTWIILIVAAVAVGYYLLTKKKGLEGEKPEESLMKTEPEKTAEPEQQPVEPRPEEMPEETTEESEKKPETGMPLETPSETAEPESEGEKPEEERFKPTV